MKRGQVKRGFSNFRSTVKNDTLKLKNIRQCKSCINYYADEGSTDEYCHDKQVTDFDMIKNGNVEYCTFWKPVWYKED